MNREVMEAMKAAFAAHLMSGAALMLAWKTALPAERAAQLVAFEEKGARLGLALMIPGNQWIAQVLLTDQSGDFQIIDTIELALANGSCAVN